MLHIVLTPEILGPPKSGALEFRLFSLLVNPRLVLVFRKCDDATLLPGYDICNQSRNQLIFVRGQNDCNLWLHLTTHNVLGGIVRFSP